MLEPFYFIFGDFFKKKITGCDSMHFFREIIFLVNFLFYCAVAARGYTWKETGRERSQAHERRAGHFVRLLLSREVSTSSLATTVRASMRLLLLRSVAVVKSLLLPRVANVSCRISRKFSAFFCVHFWLIIRLSFVVFCFSIHRMRSSSLLWFYAMLALRLVVLFWHVWHRLSFHFFSGSVRFFGLWIGLFWVFSGPRYITCGAHRCDSMRSLSCSGVFGFGCLSFPFRLWNIFWPAIRLIFWLFSAFHYMGAVLLIAAIIYAASCYAMVVLFWRVRFRLSFHFLFDSTRFFSLEFLCAFSWVHSISQRWSGCVCFFFVVGDGMEKRKLTFCSFFPFSSLARCTLLSFACDFSGYKYLPFFYPCKFVGIQLSVHLCFLRIWALRSFPI
jgi:hypothetical protein